MRTDHATNLPVVTFHYHEEKEPTYRFQKPDTSIVYVATVPSRTTPKPHPPTTTVKKTKKPATPKKT